MVRTRMILDGVPYILVPEHFLLDHRFSLDSRALVTWAWGQSLNWLFRVEDIQERLGITRGKWRTLSSELTKCGFLSRSSEPVPGSVPIHNFRLNFLVFEGTNGSFESSQSEQNMCKGLRVTARTRGEKQPLTREADNNQETKPSRNNPRKKPPPHSETARPANAWRVQGGGAPSTAALIAERLGLKEAEVGRFISAAEGASNEQLELVELIHKTTKRVKNPIALAIDLAKRAVRGELTQPRGVNRGPCESIEVGHQRRLQDLNGAVFADSSGPKVRVEDGRLRSLQHPGEPLLHPSDIAKVIANWENGLLDLRHPHR